MTSENKLIQEFASHANKRRYTRRQVIRAGAALGLSAAAVSSVLAMPAFAQDSAASPAADGPVMVPIVGKEMTFDEIKAAIADEGEVNVGNWTYSANDALIKRFQDYIKDVYGESIKLNYSGSQTPSTYITDLTIAVGAGTRRPTMCSRSRRTIGRKQSPRATRMEPHSWRISCRPRWCQMPIVCSIR